MCQQQFSSNIIFEDFMHPPRNTELITKRKRLPSIEDTVRNYLNVFNTITHLCPDLNGRWAARLWKYIMSDSPYSHIIVWM